MHESDFYTVIFDETTDASHTSKLSLSLNYGYDSSIEEVCVGFLDLHETNYKCVTGHEPNNTGDILGKSLLKLLKDI